MERRAPPPTVDFPKPWDLGPATREQWEKYKHRLMSGYATGHGSRPEEWWIYEKNMEMPEHQARVLYEMGELKGGELQLVMKWWRDHYDKACEMQDFWGRARTKYWRWNDILPSLIEEWDAERQDKEKTKNEY
jgi:hypothetical protein